MQLLLRRRGTVYPPTPAGAGADAAVAAGVDLLETDLVDRGWLLAPALRQALTRLDTADLVNVGTALLADCDSLLGADRPHVPLFRDFPHSTPDDTLAFFVDRILAAWFQAPEQPCVLCATDGAVAPVDPCGHLVCRACFDGADFSACPICHRRINPDDAFLRPARPRHPRGDTPGPQRLRVLHLGLDLDADLRAELAGLVARAGALPPAEVDDLAAILALQRGDLSWLPERVPGRETKARLLAWLLAPPAPEAAVARAVGLVDTATDVLRMLAVHSGGEASLIGRPRLAAVPRPLRRTVDKATDAALQADLQAKGGAAAENAIASTAAVQQTLKLAGFWTGPVDGKWTPALTEALKSFQTALGVKPTGTVDAATIAALEHAIATAKQPRPSPTPTPGR